jgi:hypothetical protein
MMNVPLVLRSASVLVCVLSATAGLSQALPAIPPSHDPAFWGRANQPYTLKLTTTTTGVDGITAPQKHSSEANVYRDAEGRVRTETFYDSGQPMAVIIEDPVKNTYTSMMVVGKTVSVFDLSRLGIPPSGRGWTVERLPSRVIDGISAEGVRFTRTIPAPAGGNGSPDMIVEEDWISNRLGVVLEQKIENRRTGTITKTASDFKQVEPDPALFTVPSDYTLPQAGTQARRP